MADVPRLRIREMGFSFLWVWGGVSPADDRDEEEGSMEPSFAAVHTSHRPAMLPNTGGCYYFLSAYDGPQRGELQSYLPHEVMLG
jgi:hypothetical protein